jgi:hypothetical protein
MNCQILQVTKTDKVRNHLLVWKAFLVLGLFLLSSQVSANPVLNFSDLVNGPSAGLNDGLGQGAIVTVWGQNIGGVMGSSRIVFTDVNGTEHEPAHVYYWKDANGAKPGGVANLSGSHKMQEFAFSVPDVAAGLGSIHVIVDGKSSNKLPFLVRNGDVFHVMASGDDNNVGSFGAPFGTLSGAVAKAVKPGSIIYLHDDLISENFGFAVVYWNIKAASSGKDNHFAIIAYPGSQPEVIGVFGFRSFNTEGQVLSKIKILTSNCDEGANGAPTNCSGLSMGVEGTNFGRIVANAISDRPGGCATGEVGAISGDYFHLQGTKIFGNEIYEYGCAGTSKFHHTTYFKIRSSAGLTIAPWEIGWNYLHDNHAKNGIHNFDLGNSGLCGDFNGPLKIHNNVVTNQGGAGIFIGTNCQWSTNFEVFNNLIFRAGLPAAWDNEDPNTSTDPNTGAIVIDDNFGFLGVVHLYHNTAVNWNPAGMFAGGSGCVSLPGGGTTAKVDLNSNLCVTSRDTRFLFEAKPDLILDRAGSSNNAWFYTGTAANPTNAVSPNLGADITDNPGLVFSDFGYSVLPSSSLLGVGNTTLDHDLYGGKRSSAPTIGAIEFVLKPLPPSNLSIQ